MTRLVGISTHAGFIDYWEQPGDRGYVQQPRLIIAAGETIRIEHELTGPSDFIIARVETQDERTIRIAFNEE